MPDRVKFLSERLRREGEKTLSFFGSLSDEQLGLLTYTDGADWKIKDVLAHFISSERSLVLLFRRIQKGSLGVEDDFSIDRFNQSQVASLKASSQKDLMEAFSDIRRNTIQWVDSLNEADLEIKGRHPFLGVTTLEEMIKLLYRHTQIHYRDIRKVLEGNL